MEQHDPRGALLMRVSYRAASVSRVRLEHVKSNAR